MFPDYKQTTQNTEFPSSKIVCQPMFCYIKVGGANLLIFKNKNVDTLQHTWCFSEGLTKLKEHLIDDLDYALVPAEGWEKFYAWYGMVDGQVRTHIYAY